MSVSIESLPYLLHSDMPNILLWSKDLEGRFIENNQFLATFYGFKSSEEMVGLSDYDLRSPVTKLADDFRAWDKQVAIHQETKTFFEIVQSAEKGTRTVIATKTPLICNKSNKIIGTFGYAIDITNSFYILGKVLTNPYSAKHPGGLPSGSFIIGEDKKAPIDLSQRQSECLFFLLRHKSIKQISHILNLSIRTIDSHIDQLKIKFDCPNKNALLEKALFLGFLYTIPESLFNKQLSIALED
jgi:DNA-binding CsgD family transcriptional regulator